MSSTSTAVVYHSGYGHTEIVAKSIAEGAAKEGQAALIKIAADGTIADGDWESLAKADAIIFGSPTYMGSASGPFKSFLDATSKQWFSRAWKDKVAGGFTNSHSLSGDKLSTLQQMAVAAAQHGMIWVSQDQMPAEQTGEANQRDGTLVNRLGSFMGVMTQAENAAPEGSIPSGDLKTAQLYGARVASVATKIKG